MKAIPREKLKILIREENGTCFLQNLFQKEKVFVILFSHSQLQDKIQFPKKNLQPFRDDFILFFWFDLKTVIFFVICFILKRNISNSELKGKFSFPRFNLQNLLRNSYFLYFFLIKNVNFT